MREDDMGVASTNNQHLPIAAQNLAAMGNYFHNDTLKDDDDDQSLREEDDDEDEEYSH
jgi:hypothetical protein